jgi:hypothetical protein
MTSPSSGAAAPPANVVPGPPAPAVPAPTDLPSGEQPGQTGPDAGIANPEAKRYADEAAGYRTQLKKLQQENEKLRTAAMTESEQAIAAAKAEGANEFKAKWRSAVAENAALAVLAEKQVAATELALRGLSLSDVDVNLDTGSVDRVAIEKKVDELIERYPMLQLPGSQPLPPVGSVSGADQRRIQMGQQVRPALDSEAKLNDLARYALGGDGRG